MPHTAIAAQILDREFLTIRGKLLEVAAALDRIERGQGPTSDDPRLEKIRDALAVLGQDGAPGHPGAPAQRVGGSAEQLQMIFSLPYDPAWRNR